MNWRKVATAKDPYIRFACIVAFSCFKRLDGMTWFWNSFNFFHFMTKFVSKRFDIFVHFSSGYFRLYVVRRFTCFHILNGDNSVKFVQRICLSIFSSHNTDIRNFHTQPFCTFKCSYFAEEGKKIHLFCIFASEMSDSYISWNVDGKSMGNSVKKQCRCGKTEQRARRTKI